jgi:hypothetical protein
MIDRSFSFVKKDIVKGNYKLPLWAKLKLPEPKAAAET